MAIRSVTVHVGNGYTVSIGSGLLSRAGELLLPQVGLCPMGIITDDTVAALYLSTLTQSLAAAGYPFHVFRFPTGEGSKNLRTLSDGLEFLASHRYTRGDCVLALGGGVTGDLAGFAAGCYMRGIRYVQLPTTLLAAVDASVGGKTAVDLAAGKNLAGLFHQPSAVLCDTATFQTLSPENFACGAAEAIKTGVLAGESLFSLTEAPGALREHPEDAVYACVSHKARVVEADEREQGLRKTLNLGHTAAHAVELLSDYAIPHGYAVSMGMAIIARAAVKMGWAEESFAKRLEHALENNGLPVTAPYSPDALADAALSDKKRDGGRITLVVPHAVGDCALMDVPMEQLSGIFSAGWEATL